MCWLYAITKYRYVPDINEILQAIDDAKKLGFRFMELEGVGPQLRVVADNVSRIKKKCDENEVQLIDFVPVLPDTMSPDREKRRKALKDFEIGCEIAEFFDTGLIQADTFTLPIATQIPYDIEKDYEYPYRPPPMKVDSDFDYWDYFEEVIVPTISECNDMAKDHELKLCIEPRVWENISNVWALELLMRQVKDNNLGAVLDTAHLAAQKMPPVQCVEMLGSRVFYVHASDSDFRTEDHLEIGKGLIDWRNLLKALKKHKYGGFIAIDIGGKKQTPSELDLLYMRSKDYLERLSESI